MELGLKSNVLRCSVIFKNKNKLSSHYVVLLDVVNNTYIIFFLSFVNKLSKATVVSADFSFHEPWNVSFLRSCALLSLWFSSRPKSLPSSRRACTVVLSRQTNFVEHLHTILDVSAIILHKVFDAFSCALSCLENARCISYNVAVFPDADGKYECQLLATDKYNSSDNLKSTKEFKHYSSLVRYLNKWFSKVRLLKAFDTL